MVSFVATLGIYLICLACEAQVTDESSQPPSFEDLLQSNTNEQFESVREVRTFEFPKDHGPHPTFQTEWWYFTGNVSDEHNAHYGYQFTIFRRAFASNPLDLDSDWAGSQLYLAHVGITDVRSNVYLVDELLSRGVLGLAGAQDSPFAIWVENWVAKGLPGTCEGCLNLTIQVKADEFAFDLELNSIKPVVLQGDRGLSQKSHSVGNASYYYSLTRLQTTGTLSVRGVTNRVTGNSWMDHEWFSSVLETEQLGWDWFSLQLDDQRELMLFQIRPRNRAKPPFKYGVLVDQRGSTRQLTANEIVLKPIKKWQSQSSTAEYPVHWLADIPELDMKLQLDAVVDAQERDASFRYWEGAIKVTGMENSQSVSGHGYLEMTGY